jgi:hypothetical protein
MSSTSSPWSSSVTPNASGHLLVRLQTEWQQLRRCPSAVAQARAWSLPYGSALPIDSLDDVLHLAGYGPSTSGHPHDDVLRELVRLAATDHLAARVVLQRLLPGISALARRRTGPGRPHREVLDEVVASAWTVICTYPVDRRRTWMAMGVLREIDYRSFRRAHRRLATFVPRPAHTFDTRPAAVHHPSPTDELRELLDDARAAGVGAADLDLARRLARGDSTSEVARAMAVTDRTVRNRRDVLAHRLRAVALAGG